MEELIHMSGKTEYIGKLQLIKLSEDDEYLKCQTDLRMIVSDDRDINFMFNFIFEGKKNMKVIIDSACGYNSGISAFNIEVMDLGKFGFILNFTLGTENMDDDAFYICSAKFDTPLPQVGFIKQLYYYFDYGVLAVGV